MELISMNLFITNLVNESLTLSFVLALMLLVPWAMATWWFTKWRKCFKRPSDWLIWILPVAATLAVIYIVLHIRLSHE
jgi:hypothetical protein